MASGNRVDLDGNPIKPITICMIGAGGFIGSHLCEKLMAETPHKVLALDVYNDKIKHLLEPDSLPWADRIQFHRLNIKNDSRLESLIRMADLVRLLWFLLLFVAHSSGSLKELLNFCSGLFEELVLLWVYCGFSVMLIVILVGFCHFFCL